MIILRKKKIYTPSTLESPPKLVDVLLDKKDYGVSFADYLAECDIEGHEIKNMYDGYRDGKHIQRCKICNMERIVETFPPIYEYGNDMIPHYYKKPTVYGEWKEGKKCWECDDSCIISRPMEKLECPKCHNIHKETDDGVFHSNGDETLLYTCYVCGTEDQVV